MIDKLINKNALAQELGLKQGSIRSSNVHKKYKLAIEDLNSLIDFWRRRNLNN